MGRDERGLKRWIQGTPPGLVNINPPVTRKEPRQHRLPRPRPSLRERRVGRGSLPGSPPARRSKGRHPYCRRIWIQERNNPWKFRPLESCRLRRQDNNRLYPHRRLENRFILYHGKPLIKTGPGQSDLLLNRNGLNCYFHSTLICL